MPQGHRQRHLPTLLLSVAALALFALRRWAPRVAGSPRWSSWRHAIAAGAATEWWDPHSVGTFPRDCLASSMPGLVGGPRTLGPMAATIALIAFMEAYQRSPSRCPAKGRPRPGCQPRTPRTGPANFWAPCLAPTPPPAASQDCGQRPGRRKDRRERLDLGCGGGLDPDFLTPFSATCPQSVLGAIIVVAVAGLVDVRYPATCGKPPARRPLARRHFSLTAFGGMVLGIASGVVLSLCC